MFSKSIFFGYYSWGNIMQMILWKPRQDVQYYHVLLISQDNKIIFLRSEENNSCFAEVMR